MAKHRHKGRTRPPKRLTKEESEEMDKAQREWMCSVLERVFRLNA